MFSSVLITNHHLLVVGRTRLGLTEVCVLFKEQDPKDEVCEPFKLPSHWALTLVFIVIGICLTFLTIMLVLLSIWKPQSEKIARVIGFFAGIYFDKYVFSLYIFI